MAEIETTVAEGVLEFTLNRPAKKNALTESMYLALLDGFARAEADEAIGAVLFKAEGGVFSAGNDIGDFIAAVQKGQGLAAADFVRRLATFSKPVVAAVDGLAVGVGCTLLLHCDLVYATAGARFSLPFVDLGLPPEAQARCCCRVAWAWRGRARGFCWRSLLTRRRRRRLGWSTRLSAPTIWWVLRAKRRENLRPSRVRP